MGERNGKKEEKDKGKVKTKDYPYKEVRVRIECKSEEDFTKELTDAKTTTPKFDEKPADKSQGQELELTKHHTLKVVDNAPLTFWTIKKDEAACKKANKLVILTDKNPRDFGDSFVRYWTGEKITLPHDHGHGH